jgi:hypothetical protein
MCLFHPTYIIVIALAVGWVLDKIVAPVAAEWLKKQTPNAPKEA